jgi:hypothetical protein
MKIKLILAIVCVAILVTYVVHLRHAHEKAAEDHYYKMSKQAAKGFGSVVEVKSEADPELAKKHQDFEKWIDSLGVEKAKEYRARSALFLIKTNPKSAEIFDPVFF